MNKLCRLVKKYFFNTMLCCLQAYVLITGSGCATSEIQPQDPGLLLRDDRPVWPPPPQKAKVKYLTSISRSSDTGIKKSWAKRTLDAFFGKEESYDILLNPYGISAYSDKIYVTDTGARLLHVFDMKNNKYFHINKTESEEFLSPIGIAVDSNEEIYMTDSMLRKVFVFDKTGKYLREIGNPELFKRPTGIAIDEERIYIVDTHGHHVLVFNKKDSHFIFSFGKNGIRQGDFNYPTNIFIDKNRYLYITDAMNFRVQIFDRDGNFLSSFGKLGNGSGNLSKPKGIAADSEGHIYVADAHFDNIQIFERDGRLLLALGKTGSGKGEMILPAGIFIDDKDKIYVADSFNRRIQIFQYLKEKM